MSPVTRSLVFASLGALAYGSWAYYVNADEGMGWPTALVQGSFSFVLTMTLTLLIERLFGQLGRNLTGASTTFALASLFMFSTAYALQFLAGAPHILMTILPGWAIGSVYAGAYTTALFRTKGN